MRFAGWSGTYGNYVQIDHGGGIWTGYAHIRPGGTFVGAGQWVEAGDLVSTGSAFPADILSSKPGVGLGVQGTVTAVSDEGKGWMRVDVETEAGISQRWLRVPEDRPRPVIERGMEVTPAKRFHAP